MKTRINKSEIFKTAWQFFRQTGKDFSECLKKAWANFKLKREMRSGIVRFYFLKVSGETREAWGTLNPEIMPQTEGSGRKPNKTVQVYFDTERNAFRCFKKFNLVTNL